MIISISVGVSGVFSAAIRVLTISCKELIELGSFPTRAVSILSKIEVMLASVPVIPKSLKSANVIVTSFPSAASSSLSTSVISVLSSAKFSGLLSTTTSFNNSFAACVSKVGVATIIE